MSDTLTKFLRSQEAAVQLAREVAATPNAYSIRVDAVNAALSMRKEDSTVAHVVADALRFETYLKEGK